MKNLNKNGITSPLTGEGNKNMIKTRRILRNMNAGGSSFGFLSAMFTSA